MALVVTAPYGNRCDKYCESFDHVCVAAAEEQNENCEIQYTKRCDEPIEGTSDMLCKCVKKNAPPFCPAPPAPPAPTPEPTPSPDARIQVVGTAAEIATMSYCSWLPPCVHRSRPSLRPPLTANKSES